MCASFCVQCTTHDVTGPLDLLLDLHAQSVLFEYLQVLLWRMSLAISHDWYDAIQASRKIINAFRCEHIGNAHLCQKIVDRALQLVAHPTYSWHNSISGHKSIPSQPASPTLLCRRIQASAA